MRRAGCRVEGLSLGAVQRNRRMLGRSWFRIALRLRNRAIATAKSASSVRADERPAGCSDGPFPIAHCGGTAEVILEYGMPAGASPRRATRERPCGFWAEPPSLAALLLPQKSASASTTVALAAPVSPATPRRCYDNTSAHILRSKPRYQANGRTDQGEYGSLDLLRGLPLRPALRNSVGRVGLPGLSPSDSS